MKLRKDLDPDDLRGKGGRPAADETSKMVDSLTENWVTLSEWQKAAKESGVSRQKFYRKYKELVELGFVEMDELTKKWRRVHDAEVLSQ